ncbi:efflux RND transporter periplasmic adaptor subunit [Tissierella sp.]|uniref:efflux RND transporter periplasmic adaptor subunit n=1 Tax=Tissierella sp. TaxID=41274 RepID=UPI0028648238|nr:efflux RND transporter periplasmic adaptor subunit [Tissierella sp.]MDR7855102.1 efflux RND transporter periplasmic adaptor subunit [Tissierella sp.]
MKARKNGFKWILGILVVMAIAAFVLGRIRSPKEIAGDEIEVKSGDVSTYYSFAGSIEAKNRQTIFAEQAIQIKEFKVQTGDMVKKDDVIYETNRGVEVKSEIDGEILDIFVEEDEQLMPGAKIIEIVDYKDLQLRVKVDEYDLKSIEKDIKASITIHALSKDFEGIVTDIAKEGIFMNGVTFFNTTISIENEGDILVGMSAEAKVLNESAEAVAILPMTAINFRDDNSPYVNVKKEGLIETVDVELGITDGINVEIKSGVNISDKVFVPKKANHNFGPPEGVRNSRNSGGDN